MTVVAVQGQKLLQLNIPCTKMYYLDLESDTKTSFGSDRESTMLFISHDSHMHARNIKNRERKI